MFFIIILPLKTGSLVEFLPLDIYSSRNTNNFLGVISYQWSDMVVLIIVGKPAGIDHYSV